MKKLDRIMAVIMTLTGCELLVFIVLQLWDRHARPAVYEAASAPWYLSIEINALIVCALMAVEIIIYLALRNRLKKKGK